MYDITSKHSLRQVTAPSTASTTTTTTTMFHQSDDSGNISNISISLLGYVSSEFGEEDTTVEFGSAASTSPILFEPSSPYSLVDLAESETDVDLAESETEMEDRWEFSSVSSLSLDSFNLSLDTFNENEVEEEEEENEDNEDNDDNDDTEVISEEVKEKEDLSRKRKINPYQVPKIKMWIRDVRVIVSSDEEEEDDDEDAYDEDATIAYRKILHKRRCTPFIVYTPEKESEKDCFVFEEYIK